MKIKIIHGLFCFLLFTTITGCKKANPSTVTNPSVSDSTRNECLRLSCTRYDFGTVDKNETKEITFSIQMENVGTKPIAIQKADASCGCLSASFDKEPIMPGKTADLTVHVKTESLLGMFSKVLFLNSSAGEGVKLIRVVGRITE